MIVHGRQSIETKASGAKRRPGDISDQDTVNCVNLSPCQTAPLAMQDSKEA